MSPTARSLAYLRSKGYTAGVVERWIAPARRRIDLGGFIDIVAWKPGPAHHGSPMQAGCILAVQSTSSANAMARYWKITNSKEAALWLASGGRIVVHGWGRRGKAGKRRLWTLTTEREITLADFREVGIIVEVLANPKGMW